MNYKYMDQIYKIKNIQSMWDKYCLKNNDTLFNKDLMKISNHSQYYNPNISLFLNKDGFSPDYEDNKKFSIVLTHDIDDIYLPFTHYPYLLTNFFSDKKIFLSQIKWIINKKNKPPYLNFKSIIDIEKNYGAKSTFFFFPPTDKIIRNIKNTYTPYNVLHFEKEIKTIIDLDFEIGMHTNYYSYNLLNKVLDEKIKLEEITHKQILGVRNHFLRFDIPGSWELLHKAGFEYDTTFGFSNSVGFKNGMCHPFIPYNLISKKFIPIMEFPLHIMDGALLKSVNYNFRKAWKITKLMIDLTISCNGVLTILFHNDIFSSLYKSDWLKLYRKILDYSYEANGWLTNCISVYEKFVK